MNRPTKQERASEIYYAFREFFRGVVAEVGGLDAALANRDFLFDDRDAHMLRHVLRLFGHWIPP
jgi:hypothetical protein